MKVGDVVVVGEPWLLVDPGDVGFEKVGDAGVIVEIIDSPTPFDFYSVQFFTQHEPCWVHRLRLTLLTQSN